ncbi:MAG: hypothetical protein ACI81T_003669 [Bacteroidia bacterium]
MANQILGTNLHKRRRKIMKKAVDLMFYLGEKVNGLNFESNWGNTVECILSEQKKLWAFVF